MNEFIFGSFQNNNKIEIINFEDYQNFHQLKEQETFLSSNGQDYIQLIIKDFEKTYKINLSQALKTCPKMIDGIIYENDSIHKYKSYGEEDFDFLLKKDYFNNGKECSFSEGPRKLLVSFTQGEEVPMSLVKKRIINVLKSFDRVTNRKETLNFCMYIPFDPNIDQRPSQIQISIPNEEDIEDFIEIEIPEEFVE